MFQLVVSLIVLLVAIVLGIAVEKDPGYLLISWHKTSVETSIWVGLAVILIVFILLYMLLRMVSHTRRMPMRMKSWSMSRRLTKSQNNTSAGLCYLAEGQWGLAEKSLVKGVKENNSPLMNYLAAARAAQETGSFDRRDEYLKDALEASPEAKLAIYLTQAQLQINGGQWNAALNSLVKLHESYPKHVFAMNLLQKVYRHQRNWPALLDLLPKLKKYKVLNEIQMQELQHGVYAAMISKAGNSDNPADLDRQWNDIPRSLRTDSDLVRPYAQYLIQRGDSKKAQDVLEQSLKKNLSSQLLPLYAQIKSKNPRKQLSIAESWLKKNPNDPDLLLCLGQMSEQHEKWDKACDYINKSIEVRPSGVAYLNLARVYEALGEQDKALQSYQSALQYGSTTVALNAE